MRHRLMIAAAALILLILAFAAFRKSTTEPDILTDLPEDQKQFCQIIGASGATNLGKAIASLGPAGKFSAWHGQGSVHSHDGRMIGITFTPACPDSSLSIALEDGSGITTDSAFGHALQASDFSKGMIVSGKLVTSRNGSPLVAQFVSPARFSQPKESPSGSALGSTVAGWFGQDQQTRFCKILQNIKVEQKRIADEASRESNPFKREKILDAKDTVLPKAFDELYALVSPSGSFTGWKGTFEMGRTATNALTISFHPDCQLDREQYFLLQTIVPEAFAVEKYGIETSIPLDSPLGKVIQKLDYTKKTHVASGQFIWAPLPPHGKWDFLDTRYHFYPTHPLFDEDALKFGVRFTAIE